MLLPAPLHFYKLILCSCVLPSPVKSSSKRSLHVLALLYFFLNEHLLLLTMGGVQYKEDSQGFVTVL